MKYIKKMIACLLALLTLSSCMLSSAFAYDVSYDRTGYPNTYTNTGDYATDLVNVALTQVGYKENPDAADYTKYSNWYFGKDYSFAWCGIFVSWCAEQAGIPTDVIHRNLHVSQVTYDTYADYTSGGDYFGGTPYNFGSKDPVPGDLFFSTTQEGYEKSTHVGIIWKVDSNYIYTIEGNTHIKNASGEWVGQVANRMYNRKTGYQYYSTSKTTSSYVHILFYVHPDYENAGKAAEAATDTVASFRDVASDAYYADAVQWAVQQKITNGTTADTFSPAKACTRGQVATFLYRYYGADAQIDDDRFTDVSKNKYYYYPITWCAVSAQIVNGTSATTFEPDAAVTRAQFLTMLYRSAGSPAAAVGTTFTDVSADAYYASAVYWASETGITRGTSASTFSPYKTCTRAETVTFLYRYYCIGAQDN